MRTEFPFASGAGGSANDEATGNAAAGWSNMSARTMLFLSAVGWFVAHVVVELIAHLIIGLPVFGVSMAAGH